VDAAALCSVTAASPQEERLKSLRNTQQQCRFLESIDNGLVVDRFPRGNVERLALGGLDR
jgi:hypothetical protein